MTTATTIDAVATMVADWIRREAPRHEYADLTITIKLDAKRDPFVELGTVEKVRFAGNTGGNHERRTR